MAIFCLAAGEIDAGLEAAADDLLVARRQRFDHLGGHRALRRGADAAVIVHRIDLADADVLGRGEVIAHEILEDHADVGAQIFEVIVAQVAAVEQDATLVGFVQPRQQLHQRGLAGAVLADQRQQRRPAAVRSPMAQCPAFRVGIAEADVLEHEARAIGRGTGTASGFDTLSGVISKNEYRPRGTAPAPRPARSRPAILPAIAAAGGSCRRGR